MRPRWLTRRLDALPIRWRLAVTSAGLTFVILLVFAVVIGMFTANRLRSDFDNDLRATAAELDQRLQDEITIDPFSGETQISGEDVVAATVGGGATGDAAVRILYPNGDVLFPEDGAIDLGTPAVGVREAAGYRVVSEAITSPGGPTAAAYLQYGRPESSLDSTIARVNLFLGIGVVGGTGLALLAGLAVARRAMGPIADLTGAAREIVRTRDPAARMPQPSADDEVADLARTLTEMLRGLDASQREIEATLAREREFVADASHELRTPLTSVLANLELLEAELQGEDREIAGSALRSTQRMRRLVGDLLFLARADAGQSTPATLAPTDLTGVVREVVAETAPLVASHEVSVDAAESVRVEGSPDDLHRLALNLIQNAVAHTPPGTRVTASVRQENGRAILEVTDDGPGVPDDVRDRVFDRFVRGHGDGRGAAGLGGRGSGLGLAIVQAVAEAHGGSVELREAPGGGALFRVTLPVRGAAEAEAGTPASARSRAP
jgi:two-component system, OmpR family, sensor kinase